jgi:hypothetical protein
MHADKERIKATTNQPYVPRPIFPSRGIYPIHNNISSPFMHSRSQTSPLENVTDVRPEDNKLKTPLRFELCFNYSQPLLLLLSPSKQEK